MRRGRPEAVIVGFDGSEESRDALRLASALASAEDAELHVAFVQHRGPLSRGGEERSRERFDQVFAAAETELGAVAYVAERIEEQSAPAGLDRLARSVGATLIVVGSTHRGGLGTVLPGSVGQRLCEGAPCAVAVAPRGYGRGEHYGVGLVGVAYDGSEESKLALLEARRLARRLGARLRLIGVVPELASTEVVAPRLEELRKPLVDQYRHELETAVAGLGNRIEVESKLSEGDPAVVLADEGVELDLLVTGSRGYGPVRSTLLGAVSGAVMRNSPCPVLVVPRGGANGGDRERAR